MIGIVGNDLHNGHGVSSFKMEEIAQARLLTVQGERVLTSAAPCCSYETLLWSLGCPFLGEVQQDIFSLPRTREF